MTQRRWQPPPLENAPAAKAPGVTVDEQVVRKMLTVNPALRKGRTTIQVKRALERGEPVASQAPEAPVAAPSSVGRELAESVGFFLRGKAEGHKRRLADIEARRRALAEEEQKARAALRSEVVAFVSMLDGELVRRHGAAALASHAGLLGELGLGAQELFAELERVARRGR